MVVIPPTLATSASCSDQFCQMKSLRHATLPAVKGHFSLVSAFLTDFGSRSTATLWRQRPWKRLGGLQGTPVWGTQCCCLVL